MNKKELMYILRLDKRNHRAKYSLRKKYKENAFVINQEGSEFVLYFCQKNTKYEYYRSLFIGDIYAALCWEVASNEFRRMYYQYT